MTFDTYILLEYRLAWLCDFHPEFLKELSQREVAALKRGFVFDLPDDEYPASLQAYFYDNVLIDSELQRTMLSAMERLFQVSGSGSLADYIKGDLQALT